MKVGTLVGGLEVVDVKRVNKMNLIQFTKAVSEYIELGYKIDVHSSRQIGLVLQCDMYKLESNVSEGSVGFKEDLEPKNPVETTVQDLKEPTENLTDEERLENLEASVEEAKTALGAFTTPEQNDATVKKTRAKKTT